MHFESVRLLHAQAIPHTYIANQVYDPVDDDHRKSGSFLILLEHRNSLQGTFVASLINTLIRDYYRLTAQDRISCFEKALLRINEQIKQYAKAHDIREHDFLSGVVVLVLNNEIHITHTGTPTAFLLRNSAPLNLVDTSHKSESIKIPQFSVITSGEVLDHDTLALLTGYSGVATPDNDLLFAMSQGETLFDIGRGFARILRQNQERAVEGLFVTFGSNAPQSLQIYVDRPLESPSERLAEVSASITKQTTLIGEGLSYIFDRATTRIKHPTPHEAHDNDTTNRAEEDSPTSPFVEDELESLEPSEEIRNELPVDTTENSPHDFQVSTYWQRHAQTPQPAPHRTEPTLTKVTKDHQLPFSKLPRLKQRTAYLLVGSFIILAIIIRITNGTYSPKTPTGPSAAERDAIIAQAEDAKRQATTAQLEENLPQAVTHLLNGLSVLSTLSEETLTERGRILKEQTQASLDSLTKTTYISKNTDTLALPIQPKKVTAAANSTYILTTNNQVLQTTPTGTSPLSAWPSDITPLDATTVQKGANIAILGQRTDKTPALATVTEAGEVAILERADAKPWPESRILANFENYFYLVGDTMWKAVPASTDYRVSAYANSSPTKLLTSVTNNGFAFYGVESNSKLVRIAANTSVTPIALSGMPAEFLPKEFTILQSPIDGLLYLFDKAGQRIIVITTEGTYRRQYKLTSEAKLQLCDANSKHFVCATDKELLTFTIPAQ